VKTTTIQLSQKEHVKAEFYNVFQSTAMLKLFVREATDIQKRGTVTHKPINLTKSVAAEPEGSPPHSQQLVTGFDPEPNESTPHLPATFPKNHSDSILPATLRSSEWSLSLGLSHQNFVHFLSSPMRPTCLAHLILPDLMCLMIFGDDDKL
jgi:hypothetical protein